MLVREAGRELSAALRLTSAIAATLGERVYRAAQAQMPTSRALGSRKTQRRNSTHGVSRLSNVACRSDSSDCRCALRSWAIRPPETHLVDSFPSAPLRRLLALRGAGLVDGVRVL